MKEYNGILIISEENKGEIHKLSYELLGKAKQISQELNMGLECLLLTGRDVDAKELSYAGADKVYIMKNTFLLQAEESIYSKNITAFIEEKKPKIVLFGATNFGRSLAPRVAARLETGLTADCTDLQLIDDEFIQIRPAFSDNILAHIKTVTNPKMATVRYKEFQEAERDLSRKVVIEKVEPYYRPNLNIKIKECKLLSEEDITEAKIVVAGGRGIKKTEDLKLLQALADVLGGKVGVSRALVDGGLADSSIQVGYSGNRVKPKLYIACGISGAPQHVAGMKEADMIIAINKDASAPIFKIADYGYVGDLYEVIPQLIEKINKERSF